MKTIVFLRIEIIVLGLFLLGLIFGIIYNCVKEKTISSFFIGFLGFLLLGGIPAWGFYINLNKYLTKPKLVTTIKTRTDGEICLVYQDTTHLCHASDKNSTMFTSYLSPNGEASQTDTCILCLRPFLAHDTREEHRYYEAMSYMNESMDYCCNFNDTNPIETDDNCSHGINGFKIYMDNTRKNKEYNKKAFCTFAFQNQVSIMHKNKTLIQR